MNYKDSELRDALIELANLRARDERLRRSSEAIAGALQALGDENDWYRGPAILVDHLGKALCTADVALTSIDSEVTRILAASASPAFSRLLDDQPLLHYLEKKPSRILPEPAALKNALGLNSALDQVGVLMSGRIRVEDARWLVLCGGGTHLNEPEARDMFQRFLPIFLQALQRLVEGRRAIELARREREIMLAKEKAEAASRAKSEFVSRMSHELRTPLNAIIGFAQLLSDEPLTLSQKNYVHLIASSGEHLLELINAVLDHAKIESGKLTLERIPFDLPGLLDSVAHMVNQQASAKGLHFEVHARNVPPRIVGDPTRLRQILINLLANAIKFTEQGSVELRMTHSDGVLYFSVRDTGIGMDEAARGQLFKPFSQGDESIARKFGGTGLGLLIARELLQAMGGDIDIDSAPGVGTCFWGHMPYALADGALQDSPPAPTDRVAPIAQGNHLANRRVLVVDDNPINRKLAGALLERMGMCVTTAENGREALDRIAAGGIELVLMDVEMPEMDGLSATRALRENETRTQAAPIPVIALTANAMAEDRARCLAAGMDGYVAKPIVVVQLRQEIERLLRR